MFSSIRRYQNADTMVITVHPKHEIFQRAIMFEVFGGLKDYESVRGNPAVALKLNLDYTGYATVMELKHFFGLDDPKAGANEQSPKKPAFKLTEWLDLFLGSRQESEAVEQS